MVKILEFDPNRKVRFPAYWTGLREGELLRFDPFRKPDRSYCLEYRLALFEDSLDFSNTSSSSDVDVSFIKSSLVGLLLSSFAFYLSQDYLLTAGAFLLPFSYPVVKYSRKRY